MILIYSTTTGITAGQRRWRRVHCRRPARRGRLGARGGALRGAGGAGGARGEPGAVATLAADGWEKRMKWVRLGEI